RPAGPGGGARVTAGRLVLLLLGGAILLPACLIAQEDHILQDLPEPANLPPRIVESLVQPANRFVTARNGSDCPILTFSAPVSDPDVTDHLTYNFYVDPDLFPPPVKQADIANNGQADRSDPAIYEVSFATPGPLQQPGDHVVEVLVSDGALVNRVPQP